MVSPGAAGQAETLMPRWSATSQHGYTLSERSSPCTRFMWMPLTNTENASLPASPCTCCIHGGSQCGGRIAPDSKIRLQRHHVVQSQLTGEQAAQQIHPSLFQRPSGKTCAR